LKAALQQAAGLAHAFSVQWVLMLDRTIVSLSLARIFHAPEETIPFERAWLNEWFTRGFERASHLIPPTKGATDVKGFKIDDF